MPSCGSSLSLSGVRRLAVGNPSVLPRPSPRTTTPRSEYGLPSASAAARTSPASSRLRISDDETEPPSSSTASTTCTGKPRSRANAAQRVDVAAPALAKSVIVADHEPAHLHALDQDLVDEPLGAVRGQLPGERQEDRVVEPGLGEDVALLGGGGEQLGALSGRTMRSGCG